MGRRAKMKRMSTEDCASMLSSRALPENFDMTPALRETYGQESVNVRARTLSQGSVEPSGWEQRRASLKRSSFHQDQNSGPMPMVLQGTPHYSSLATNSPAVQRRSSLASSASYHIGARNDSVWSDSVTNVSQPSTDSYNQYTLLQDGSTFSNYGSGLIESNATLPYAGAGASYVHETASAASEGRPCGFAMPGNGLSGQMNAYDYQELMHGSKFMHPGE